MEHGTVEQPTYKKSIKTVPRADPGSPPPNCAPKRHSCRRVPWTCEWLKVYADRIFSISEEQMA